MRSQGIGNAIAHGLAAEGARIVSPTCRAPRRRRRRSHDGVGLTVDVADEAARPVACRRGGGALRSIDILVNNAGLYASLAMRPFTEIPLAEWRQVMDVNVASHVPDVPCDRPGHAAERRRPDREHLVRDALPRGPFLLHYVTSKGAIVAFTRALAKEVGKDGVLVNCVAPGFTMSAGVEAHPEVIEKLRDVSVAARTAAARSGAGDVVGAVVYFASAGSSFVTGQTIVIDGGQTFH